jgi:hypothetical protein
MVENLNETKDQLNAVLRQYAKCYMESVANNMPQRNTLREVFQQLGHAYAKLEQVIENMKQKQTFKDCYPGG